MQLLDTWVHKAKRRAGVLLSRTLAGRWLACGLVQFDTNHSSTGPDLVASVARCDYVLNMADAFAHAARCSRWCRHSRGEAGHEAVSTRIFIMTHVVP